MGREDGWEGDSESSQYTESRDGILVLNWYLPVDDDWQAATSCRKVPLVATLFCRRTTKDSPVEFCCWDASLP